MAALTSGANYRITYEPAIPEENHALTQAFYYSIFAAVLYFCITILMCLTVYGANRHYYKKEFSLTVSQRTLVSSESWTLSRYSHFRLTRFRLDATDNELRHISALRRIGLFTHRGLGLSGRRLLGRRHASGESRYAALRMVI